MLPNASDIDASEWLPMQMALQGLLAGSDTRFIELAWPYQSWVFFADGVPVPGVEELPPNEFFDHCYTISKLFHEEYPQHLATVIAPNIDDVPVWTGISTEKNQLFALINSRYGYNPLQQSLPIIEQKQVNACIIYVLFCSMCKAARLQ